MQQEAQQSAAYVGEPVEGALAVGVAGAGGDTRLVLWCMGSGKYRGA